MADQSQTKIIRIVIDASKAVDGSSQATQALKNIEAQSAVTNSMLGSLQRTVESVGAAVKASLLIQLTQLALQMVEMGKSALEAAGHLDDLAQQVGVTNTFLQASQFAAAGAGVKVDELTASYAQFSKRMGEAADGSKTVIDALTELGVKNLDAQGKLRPTQDLMQEVALAILKIPDPAKQAAEAVALFGRGGQQLLPIMADIATGAGAMAAKARDAGAMVDKEATAALKRMADQSEQSSLKIRALFANLGAPIVTAALEAVNKLLASILANLDRLKQQAVQAPVTAIQNDVGQLNDQIANEQARLAINPNNSMAKASIDALTRRRDAALEARDSAQRNINQSQMQDDEARARLGGPPSLPSEGASTSVSKEDATAAENLAEKIKKATDSLAAAAVAQTAMTAAARLGDTAFVDQEAHLQALQKAIETYGGKLDATDPKVKALAATFEGFILTADRAKVATTFVVGTNDLDKQNALLQTQLSLAGQSTEEIAKQVDLQKAMQDAQKAGKALSADDIAQRAAAIDQQYALKAGIDDTARSTQTWLQPFTGLLSGLQTGFTSFFEGIVTTGKLSWQSLGDSLKASFARTLAEMAELALVRPVLVSIVQGVFSPGAAQSLGMGGTTGGGGIGGLLSIFSGGGGLSPGIQGANGTAASAAAASAGGGSNGLLSMLGLGKLLNGGSSSGGGLFSGFSNWFNSPVQGIDAEIANWSTYGTSAQNSLGGLGELSPGNILGGVGSVFGIGMGLNTLLSGNGSTGSTISGLSGILGGGLGLAALLPGLGALGPVGIGVGVLGAVLGGLLGGGGPAMPPQPGLDLGTGNFNPNASGGYAYSGYGMNSGTSLQPAITGIGQNVLSFLKQSGGTIDPKALIGGILQSGVSHNSYDPKSGTWSNTPYTQTGLNLPGGGFEQLTYEDSTRNAQQAADYLTAQVFGANVLRGGVTGVSPTLKTAVQYQQDNQLLNTSQDVSTDISQSRAYDIAVKGVNYTPAADAIQKINDSFDALSTWASNNGVDTAPLDKAQADATAKVLSDLTKTGTDYVASTNAAILALSNPFAAAKMQLDASQSAAITSVLAQQGQINNTPGAAPVDMLTSTLALQAAQQKQLQEQHDAQVLQFTDSMKGIETSIANPTQNTLDGLSQTLQANLRQAALLGGTADQVGQLQAQAVLAYQAQVANLKSTFVDQITQGDLSITNPLQASINAIEKQKAAALQTAADFNAPAQAQYDALSAQKDGLIQSVFGTSGTNYMDPSSPIYAAVKSLDDAMATVSASFVSTAAVAKYYSDQETQVRQQFYAQELGGLEALIQNLTFGPLSGASPASIVAGAGAQYRSDLTAAQGGDLTALQNLSASGSAFISADQNYEGGSAGYFAIVNGVRDALQALDISVRGGAVSPAPGTPTDPTSGEQLTAVVTSQNDQIKAQSQQIVDLTNMVASLTSRLDRFVTAVT